MRISDWSSDVCSSDLRIWNAARHIPGLRAPTLPSYCRHAAYKCYVFVEPDMLAEGWTRDRIAQEINERGVPCYQGSCSEVYLEKAFDGKIGRASCRERVFQYV